MRGQGKGKGMRLTFYFINNNLRAEYRETRKYLDKAGAPSNVPIRGCPYSVCDTRSLHRGVHCRCGVLAGRMVTEAGLYVMDLESLLIRDPRGGLCPVIHALKLH